MEDDYFSSLTVQEQQDSKSSDAPTIIILFLIVAIMCLFPQIAIRR